MMVRVEVGGGSLRKAYVLKNVVLVVYGTELVPVQELDEKPSPRW